MRTGLLAGVVVAFTLTLTSPANAQTASVTVAPPTADPAYATTLTVQGAGFQSVKNGHGGIYVFFGWVSDPDGGTWRPSKGGASGATFRYVQDKETKDNNGYQKFVAFPGGDTASSANGGVIAENGTWSTKLNIPGARFKAADRSGSVSEVDCTRSRCGVITVGAHGVVNANNETFTPITFAVPNQAQNPPPPPKATTQSATPTTTTPTSTTTPPTTTSSTVASTPTTTSQQAKPEPAANARPLDSGPNLWLVVGIPVVVLVVVSGSLLLRRRLVSPAQKDSTDE